MTPAARLATLLVATPALAALSGCAAVRPAAMALPAELAAAVAEPVAGIGSGRSGSFVLGGGQGRFERGRDRLDLFEAVSFDRARTRYTWVGADGRRSQAACLGRQTTASVGVAVAQPRPFTFECEWSGALPARMTVSAPSWIPGSRAERSGRFSSEGVELELRSVHRVQGSPLELEAPIGYTVSHAGRPVGAIELNGNTPRLWRPAPTSPLHEPVTLAALALALLWDPAGDS